MGNARHEQRTRRKPLEQARSYLAVGILAAPIRELRELVKDLAYRNAAERRACEMILATQRLEVMQRYGLTDADMKRLLSAQRTWR
jgi:hypothetical protein